MAIPNIIGPSVPISESDSESMEVERFGESAVPDSGIPYHTKIMERFNRVDLGAVGRVTGNGFYYLMGGTTELHSSMISYARDFTINRNFTYCMPPFMVRSNVVTGVMSFTETDAIMYEIERKNLHLIGTNEYSMIDKFIDTTTPEEQLSQTLTNYSPRLHRERDAHGIERRGVYRIHRFGKRKIIVVYRLE